MSMSAVVASSRVQDVKTRAVGTDNLVLRDPQENPRMTERAAPTVASDSARADADDLGRSRSRHGGRAVRHIDPLFRNTGG